MFVEVVRRPYKDKVYTAVLLRETYREGGKVKHRTLANLSALPEKTIDLIRKSLKGEPVVAASDGFKVVTSRSHGAVWAVLQVARRRKIPELLGKGPWRNLVLGMLVARIINPGSKRFTASWWHTTTLPQLLHVPDAGVNSLYEAMDHLLKRQPKIQKALAQRHLKNGSLVFYDLSSSYFEGRTCPLAAYGYSREGKRGKKQFTYGLLTDNEGCPFAIEVFRGNQNDTGTLQEQIERLKEEYGFDQVVFVGDRGMITKTRIQELKEAGYDWITALRSKAIQELHRRGVIQLTFFDEKNIAEIWDPENPDERLVAAKNPLVAQERKRKREDLLRATEARLQKVKQRVERGSLKKPEAIALAVGKVINQWKMEKHFHLDIREAHFHYQRDEGSIQKEAILDGVYVTRTSLKKEQMDDASVVRKYKDLKHVEQAFRWMKKMRLELRPVFHRLEDRVRAHAFLCMLAYYIQWHMARDLEGLQENYPHEYGSLRLVLEKLQTIQMNTVMVRDQTFQQVTEPDSWQQLLLDALNVTRLL